MFDKKKTCLSHTKKRPRTVFLAAINLERVTGIEPASSAWKAEVLPMNYTRKMVGMTGFEPATSCSQSRRATKLRHIPTLHSGIDYSRRIEIRRKDFASDRPLPFPAAPTLRASSPNEICASLTTFNPIHQGHHNHSHICTTFLRQISHDGLY